VKNKRLGELLINSGILNSEQLELAKQDQKTSGLDLRKYLVQQGLVNELELVSLISREMKVSRYIPEQHSLQSELSEIVPFDFAHKYQMAPLNKKGNLINIAITDPMNIEALDAIEYQTNCEVEPYICTEQELMQMMTIIYGMESAYITGIENLRDMELNTESDSKPDTSIEDIQVSSLQNMAEGQPIIRFVNQVLSQSVRLGASDIHISPEKTHTQIRFRIDGRLQEVHSPPKSMLLPIISRVKILANMDIATSMVPQDGRFTIKTDNKEINVRASTMPTIHGENVVLRLLDMGAPIYSLNRLGMTDEDVDKLSEVITKPYGMILSTGPTGSGKSTSLYAIIKSINKPDINIITLEDPVEYRVEKIRQIQLNTRAGMTFASGLRSILRQDPDVIMVGEIRDRETAEISVRAALTGHRVLSTVHTNDAAGAITRLIEMGMEPYIVSSVLLVSFAQRLVRMICPYCKKEQYSPSHKAIQFFQLMDEKIEFIKGKGCIHCMGTGYRGRTGVFEILVIN